jgi:G3E family GTPase
MNASPAFVRNPMRTAVTLVTGATGSGKTTLISRLLAKRPSHEHWAVLVNDFGKAALADAPGAIEGFVTVRDVAGCMCCTGQVLLRTALVLLLRDIRPRRLLLEASAAAEPAGIARLLLDRGVADAVELESTVCVVSPRQIADSRYLSQDAYRAQIAAADVIAVSGASTETERIAAHAALNGLRSSPARVVDAYAPVSDL